MRNIRDPNWEAAQPSDNFLFGKKNKTSVWNHVLYRDLHTLWKCQGFSTLIFLFQLRKPSTRELKISFPSKRAFKLGF